MNNVTHLFKSPVWTRYESEMQEAVAYAENAKVAYAATLPDSERPDSLTRRRLFREVTEAAGAFES